jgi:hypothetical protein
MHLSAEILVTSMEYDAPTFAEIEAVLASLAAQGLVVATIDPATGEEIRSLTDNAEQDGAHGG